MTDFTDKATDLYIDATGTGPTLTIAEKYEMRKIRDALREAYEQGKRDENEACAALAAKEGWVAYECDPLSPSEQIRQRIPNVDMPKETKNGQ